MNGVSVLAQIVIASFVIDRVVSGVLFVALLAHLVPDAEMADGAKDRVKAERVYKLVYFVLAAALVVAVMLSFPGIRILASLGMQVPIDLDRIVTGLLFLGGAERLSQFLQTSGSAGDTSEAKSAPSPPIAIEGTLMLIGSPEQTNLRITRDQGAPPR